MELHKYICCHGFDQVWSLTETGRLVTGSTSCMSRLLSRRYQRKCSTLTFCCTPHIQLETKSFHLFALWRITVLHTCFISFLCSCSGAWLPVCVYLVFNCSYNVFIVWPHYDIRSHNYSFSYTYSRSSTLFLSCARMHGSPLCRHLPNKNIYLVLHIYVYAIFYVSVDVCARTYQPITT